jgi:hypothetical protein
MKFNVSMKSAFGAIGLLVSAALIGSAPIGLAQTPTETPTEPQPTDRNTDQNIDQMPVEQAPVEAPIEQAPAEQAPAEQAPAEQAPAEQNSANPVPADYQVIMGEGWSFAVPPDWQNALSSSAELGDASIVAQLNDNQKQTVVNLVTQTYDGSGEEYIQRSVATLNDLGFIVHAQDPISVSGFSGVALEVSLTASETTVRLWQRMVVRDGVSFALTCGGPEVNLEAAQPICANVLNSFQVIP